MKTLFEITNKTREILPSLIQCEYGVQVKSRLDPNIFSWYVLNKKTEKLLRRGHPRIAKEHKAKADKILVEKDILTWKLDVNNLNFLFKVSPPTNMENLKSILLEKGWTNKYLESEDFTDMEFNSSDWVVACVHSKQMIHHVTHPNHSNYSTVLAVYGHTPNDVVTIEEYVKLTKTVNLIDMFYI